MVEPNASLNENEFSPSEPDFELEMITEELSLKNLENSVALLTVIT